VSKRGEKAILLPLGAAFRYKAPSKEKKVRDVPLPGCSLARVGKIGGRGKPSWGLSLTGLERLKHAKHKNGGGRRDSEIREKE